MHPVPTRRLRPGPSVSLRLFRFYFVSLQPWNICQGEGEQREGVKKKSIEREKGFPWSPQNQSPQAPTLSLSDGRRSGFSARPRRCQGGCGATEPPPAPRPRCAPRTVPQRAGPGWAAAGPPAPAPVRCERQCGTPTLQDTIGPGKRIVTTNGCVQMFRLTGPVTHGMDLAGWITKKRQ